MTWLGHEPIYRPPFAWLQGLIILLALYITALILITTQREDDLAGYCEQLTLELAVDDEQNSTKLIELLGELRRDSPLLADRNDHHAVTLSTPADPYAVLAALKGHQTAEGASGIRSWAPPSAQTWGRGQGRRR